MKKVIVLRGISGAGKSTWVKEKHPDAVIASADLSFLQEDGSYQFDPAKVHDAHKQCYQTFMQAIIKEKPLIIIDNSNLHIWEISPYVMPAQSFGYDVEIVTIECDPEVAIERKDWVPPEKVREMAQILKSEEERFPDFMKKIHRKIDYPAKF